MFELFEYEVEVLICELLGVGFDILNWLVLLEEEVEMVCYWMNDLEIDFWVLIDLI